MERTEQEAEETGTEQQWLDQDLLNRFGTPADFTDTALFLASDRAGFITGENIVLDGGLTSGLPTSFVNEIYQADKAPARE